MSDGDGRQSDDDHQPATDSRPLLDDEGRLFGLVNIVDVLVVLLLLAVVIAGLALLFPSDGEAENRYVTLDMGPQPEYVAEQISVGDEWDPDGTSDALTITDVYRYNTEEGTAVIARAQVNGTLLESNEPEEDPVFEFLGDPLRVGQSLGIQTPEYVVEEATVTHVDRSGELLSTSSSAFVIETAVSAETAAELEAGDEFTAGGDVFGEVTAVEVFPAGEDTLALVGLSMTTLERGGSQYLGETRVSVGSAVSLAGDGYDIDGEIVRRGTDAIDTEYREFVLRTDVSTTVADDIQQGDEYRVGDVSLVSVEGVTVYATGDANTRTVVLGVSALTREDGGTVVFGDQSVRLGSSLPVETDEYDIEGEVVRRGTLEEAGTPRTQSVTMKLENTPPERAAGLSVGLTEQTRGLTSAEVTDVTTQPAAVVLESEDGDIFLREHPRNVDVELTVDLEVRELDDGTVQFRGETIRSGQTVSLELDDRTIDGEIIEFNR